MTAPPLAPGPDLKPDPFRHLAIFYDNDLDFLTQTQAFVDARLANEEPVLVALPLAHAEALRAEMGASAAGVRWVDMTEAGRNPGRILPFVLDAFVMEHRGRRVAMVGEPVWPERGPKEYAAAVRHEALINLSFAGQPVTVMCPYDRSKLSPTALIDAEATHPELSGATGSWSSGGYADPAVTAADALEPFEEPPPGAAVFIVVDPADLGDMRTFIGVHATSEGMSGERLADLRLAVHEVCANSVTHSSGPGIVCLWRAGAWMVCEIHDSGRITDPLVGRRAAARSRDAGHGLLLVNSLCDLVELETRPDGVTTRLHVALR